MERQCDECNRYENIRAKKVNINGDGQLFFRSMNRLTTITLQGCGKAATLRQCTGHEGVGACRGATAGNFGSELDKKQSIQVGEGTCLLLLSQNDTFYGKGMNKIFCDTRKKKGGDALAYVDEALSV